ncbi:S1 family peptidase [Streptomyces ficellus]|uniref:S1 family peptidase n=1 Tax=Streptomyces ficellus TaxID=1977088 RepID=A0A6I6FEM1_9ACTN|nr:S1 family peptidase [Streptomyces ficellus]QGV76929.1 S1 family peptidase [Streptomyces ficellus]
MKHGRRTLRRAIRLAAVGGLLCGGLMVSQAVAGEPATDGRTAAGTPAPAADLVARLGTSRTAGSWIGADGRPVVAVTDDATAAEVRRAGARAEVKRHSMRELDSARKTLAQAPRVPGTAWVTDYASNEVKVYADRTVSAADWSRMTDVAERAGDFVRMQRTDGAFTTRVNGAVPIFNGTGRCSVGFNVTDGRDNFMLTAGHCGPVGTPWFRNTQAGSGQLGTTIARNFPGKDFSLVRYDDRGAFDGSNAVDIGQGKTVPVIGAADPVVGQQVFRSGSTTGLRSGRVTALDATVNYREGTVTGLIATTVCAEPGDSGGPLLAEGLALGVTSGGNGDCSEGGMTFFQPVTSALTALGVRVIDGRIAARGNTAAAPSASPAPPSSPGDAAGAGSGTGTGTGAGAGEAAVPPAQGLAPPGATGQWTIAGVVVEGRRIVPGLAVIGVSLLGLIATRWLFAGRIDRHRLQAHYSQHWG